MSDELNELLTQYLNKFRNTKVTTINNVDEIKQYMLLKKHFEIKNILLENNTLSLINQNLNLEDIKLIAEFVSNNPTIKTLDLSDNNIGDFAAGILAKSIGENITYLNLANNNIGNIGFNFIKNSITKNIQYLDLSNNQITDLSAPKVSLWTNNGFAGLLHLNLAGNQIDDQGMQSVYSKNERITYGYEHAISHFDLSSYQYFNISNNNLGYDGAQSLLNKIRSNYPLNIDVSNNDIGSVQLLTIAGLFTKMDFSNNNLGDENAVNIVAGLYDCRVVNRRYDQRKWKICNDLKEKPITLNLSANNITDIGAELIAWRLPKISVKVDLDLSNNNITDVGAESIAYFLRESNVTNLDLSHNAIRNPDILDKLQNIARLKNTIIKTDNQLSQTSHMNVDSEVPILKEDIILPQQKSETTVSFYSKITDAINNFITRFVSNKDSDHARYSDKTKLCDDIKDFVEFTAYSSPEADEKILKTICDGTIPILPDQLNQIDCVINPNQFSFCEQQNDELLGNVVDSLEL